MSISSIFSSSATDPLSQLYAPTPAAPAPGIGPTLNAKDPVNDPVVGGTSTAATSTSVSDGAKLLKQLQDLQKSDPAEFKKATADIAAQLTAAAQTAGGSEGNALTSRASKFIQASQTGTLTSLQSGHHHGGHHHAAAASSDSSTSSTSSTSSAVSSAIAAYQQAGSQSSPLSGATTTLRSQVSGIISQVLTTDLGSTPAGTTASISAYV